MKRWGKKGREGGEVAYLLSSLSSPLAGEGGGARAVHGGGQQDGWGPGGTLISLLELNLSLDSE